MSVLKDGLLQSLKGAQCSSALKNSAWEHGMRDHYLPGYLGSELSPLHPLVKGLWHQKVGSRREVKHRAG